MKLNLGCGAKQLKGYVNIDARDIPGVDLVYDITTPLPYENETAEKIIATDVLEHITYRKTDEVFEDWVRVLKKGGEIEVTVPDIDKHMRMYLDKVVEGRTGKPVDIERLRHIIFGCQDHPFNFHYTTFNEKDIARLFNQNGLSCFIIHTQKAMIVTGVKL